MNRFLIRMFLRTLTAYDRWLPTPIGGSKNAAIFGTGLWLSVWLRDSLPAFLHPQDGSDWLYFALWIPVLFACDRYVDALVRQYDNETTTTELARPDGRGDALYFLLQWASILLMLIVIAEARSTG